MIRYRIAVISYMTLSPEIGSNELELQPSTATDKPKLQSMYLVYTGTLELTALSTALPFGHFIIVVLSIVWSLTRVHPSLTLPTTTAKRELS
jgi:hypothetical protein